MKLHWERTPQKDVLVGIVLAVLVGFLFSRALATEGATVERKSTPFQTHANMLLVRVTLNRDKAPTIDRVEKLESGRVTVTTSGANKIELLDQSGSAVYSQTFEVLFLRVSDPPEVIESLPSLFVLPYDEKVRRVRVTTPNGTAEYTLEG